MELIKGETRFDFLKWRWFCGALSIFLIGWTVFLWVDKGEQKFGVDFRGGNEFVVRFDSPAEISGVRDALASGGFPDAVVQNFENAQNEFTLRLSAKNHAEVTGMVKSALSTIQNNKFVILKEDYVGPVIGEQIRRDAVIATLIGLVGILVYVTVQFDLRFALGAVIAVFHDSIIATGGTILMGKEISSGTLAAVLTIVGYSVNDTIIIYDRIRENLGLAAKTGSAGKKERDLKGMTLAQIMNLSINQTLRRTILTSMTVYFVAFTLWTIGGGAVSDLSFTLLIGTIVGTYSTIFIACPIVLAFQRRLV